MTKKSYGWCGKILKINLTDSRITEMETSRYADRFLGGRGIATRIYWEEVRPETRAFDADNRLIFMTGPLGATGVQGASRFEVVGKSPMLLPEGFCYGNMGGYFGPYLKRSGYDGIVIYGRSKKPVYLWINDGDVRIIDAATLWGKGVYAVRDHLRDTHGKNVRFVTMGVAGENLCRTANLMTDNEGSATGGFGAVMGSKNLKAVAVLGSGHPRVADPHALKDLNRLTIHLNQREPMFVPFPEDQVRRIGKASCYQCGLDCLFRSSFRTASGKNVVRKCQSIFVYFPWVMGRQGESAETAVEATGICNDLSICTMEMYNIIQWMASCYKAGYLTDEKTGLAFSQLGTLEFFETLANMIARREGFGDILAEGLLRAGKQLGAEAQEYFANEVSAVGDGATYSAREYLMNGLLYALEPRQPIAMLHEVSRIIGLWVMNLADPSSSPVSSEVYRKAAATFWGDENAWDLTVPAGKAVAAVKIMDRTIVKDSLLLCDSSWPLMVSWNTPDHVGDPTLESRIFTAVTGIAMDEEGLHRYGERVFNLQRAVLLREGWRPDKDDILADFNYSDPVETVFMNPDVIVPGLGEDVISLKGHVLSLQVFKEMRSLFYGLRGWDNASGLQREETLKRLDLEDLIQDLNAQGLIAGPCNRGSSGGS
jgi:aldehyde:ferredoxin oxidoreductase